MKQKIKNKWYRQFLDTNVIETLGIEQIEKAINNVKGRYVKQGRSLIIFLYYTGSRPAEALTTKGKQITKEKSYCVIKMHTLKKGVPRMIYLSFKKPFVKELFDYSQTIFPEMYLFFNFQGKYIRNKINKKGITKEYIEISDKLRYHFHKWFDSVVEEGISPYFLRHNRISKFMLAGGSLEEARQLKGAKDVRSVMPYSHMSAKSAKKIDRMIE